MRLLIAIITVIFSLQAALMPAMSAAGMLAMDPAPGASADAANNAKPAARSANHNIQGAVFTDVGASVPPPDSKTPAQEKDSCCSLNYGCPALAAPMGSLFQAVTISEKDVFQTGPKLEAPSYPLPHPPRIINI
ncbi:MAG TPA: hypothetical protein VD713_01835 [Sphingomonadales bacterium]|nr:hypothetical protein [Sphingomonadales bacterium]